MVLRVANYWIMMHSDVNRVLINRNSVICMRRLINSGVFNLFSTDMLMILRHSFHFLFFVDRLLQIRQIINSVFILTIFPVLSQQTLILIHHFTQFLICLILFFLNFIWIINILFYLSFTLLLVCRHQFDFKTAGVVFVLAFHA